MPHAETSRQTVCVDANAEASPESDSIPSIDEGQGRSASWSALVWLQVAGVVGIVVLAVTWLTHLPTPEPLSPLAAPVTLPTEEAAVVAPTVVPTESSAVARVDAAWVARVSSATGIPARALVAYAAADLELRDEQPGCGISWTTLAGIGSVESDHGSHDGAALGEDGVSAPVIRGPLLTIRDTDDGRWDGDTQWDRAVGPLQFIPDSWARWGADGDGDGSANPNQIDDAALTAARYLCDSGSMSDAGGWRAAVYSFNALDSYVDDVATRASAYAEAANRG